MLINIPNILLLLPTVGKIDVETSIHSFNEIIASITPTLEYVLASKKASSKCHARIPYLITALGSVKTS